MILDNHGRLVLNDQNPYATKWTTEISWVYSEAATEGVLLKKVFLNNFANFTGKHLRLSLLQACNFIKKRLQHWRFPVKFAKLLRTSILKKIYERLLLFVSPQDTIANSGGEFGLDETLTECKVSFIKQNNFIRSNTAISFIYINWEMFL